MQVKDVWPAFRHKGRKRLFRKRCQLFIFFESNVGIFTKILRVTQSFSLHSPFYYQFILGARAFWTRTEEWRRYRAWRAEEKDGDDIVSENPIPLKMVSVHCAPIVSVYHQCPISNDTRWIYVNLCVCVCARTYVLHTQEHIR